MPIRNVPREHARASAGPRLLEHILRARCEIFPPFVVQVMLVFKLEGRARAFPAPALMAGDVNVDPNRLFCKDTLVDIHLVVFEWVALSRDMPTERLVNRVMGNRDFAWPSQRGDRVGNLS